MGKTGCRTVTCFPNCRTQTVKFMYNGVDMDRRICACRHIYAWTILFAMALQYNILFYKLAWIVTDKGENQHIPSLKGMKGNIT